VHDGFPACKFYFGGNHLIENLMDFSFQRFVRPRILKMLHSVQLRVGLAAAVGLVFSGFHTRAANGLPALIIGFTGFATVLLRFVDCRVVVEPLAGIFRAIQVITNSRRRGRISWIVNCDS
jgi:hypothetical protein